MNKQYFQTIHKIITAGHRITDEVNRELKGLGISEPQYNVLRTLKQAKGGPLTVQEILEQMVQRSSNITRIVDKLIAKGCVNRQECATNRRKMDITLTKEGVSLLKKLDEKVSQYHQPMMNNLNEEELETLRTLISKLTNKEDE